MAEEPTHNPFSPPAADIEAAGAPANAPGADPTLASRWQRLGGAVVDAFLSMLALAPMFFGFSWSNAAKAGQDDSNPFAVFRLAGTWGAVAGALLLAVNVLNWALLLRRGQTVGKIVAGTRVVMLDGRPAPFVKVVVLRTWVFLVIQYVPGLGRSFSLVGLIDALMIFRADRRCLHDHLAGTKVVRVID
jgi:uncharacterized RDD family membrane protein YckC